MRTASAHTPVSIEDAFMESLILEIRELRPRPTLEDTLRSDIRLHDQEFVLEGNAVSLKNFGR